MIGNWPYEPDLRQLARRLGVLRPGNYCSPAVWRIAVAMAEAQPSRVSWSALSDYEAHPVAVMEALSVGRPVVGYEN